ncbi:MAG: CvpA family protein [Aquificae bacterium]|nr:CvpA family protein [Aquificota bacterium]
MLDIIFALIFLYLIIIGLYKGFVDLFFKFLGIGLGFFIAILWHKELSNYLSKYFKGNEVLIDFLSFAFLFLLIFSFFMVLNTVLSRYVNRITFFAFLDRILGVFLGILVFFLIMYSIYVLSLSNEAVYELMQSSKLYKHFEKFIQNYNLASVYIFAQNSKSEQSFKA